MNFYNDEYFYKNIDVELLIKTVISRIAKKDKEFKSLNLEQIHRIILKCE